MGSREWVAKFIAADQEFGEAPWLRRSFEVAKGHGGLIQAEIFATALGVCEVFVNGHRSSADLLTPGWSSYEWRLRYARWNVLDLIEPESVISILVGNGWHAGRLGFAGGRAVYGSQRAAWLELRLQYADGFTETIGTDETWQSAPSDVTADDLYDGESIDARRRDPAWHEPGTSPRGWGGVRIVDIDLDRLTPYVGPPVRRQEEIAPQRVWVSPSGKMLVDFGQNLVGWISLRAHGERGTVITVRHAEVLDDGELCVRPLRTAKSTDQYTLSGESDLFEPTLTFHGFRYAEVDGWPGRPEDLAESLSAVVIGSDLKRIGHFECSDPLLNQLHSNIVWSMRGNFVDVPTDCPQRDERLGWTGDLAAFATTAVYLYDVNDFLRDWLLDLAAEQTHAGGTIPFVVPDNFKYENRQGLTAAIKQLEFPAVALWNDAACWVPWAAWEAYGVRDALAEQFPSMAAYARRIADALSDTGLMEGIQLGDWLDPTAPANAPWEGRSDPYVIATACVYRSADIAARAAHVLGRADEEEEFADLAKRIRRAFNEHYVTQGRIRSDSPAAYALAISFGLLDEAEIRAAGERLAELVIEAGFRITTGFAGTPFILGALSETGHLDTAYRLLLETGCPSWLYPVTMGATTIWERWDSLLPDGSVNPGEMTSFNHYAFGAVGDWLHRVVAGLVPLEPGYRSFLVAPRPGGGLTWAKTELNTPYGAAAVVWHVEDDRLVVDVTVPEGTTALLRIEGFPQDSLPAGQHRAVTAAPGQIDVRQSANRLSAMADQR
ncbi:family 78 glycoside hydrolase catalytic domain [Sinomonas sp. P47F7]|uniref:alpha-L-rhamnosidase n=1 Tax=Sinomonas sp. P47F7 TaxID=3410987 RepID=UPI003BF51786